jgi:hypothetical protein
MNAQLRQHITFVRRLLSVAGLGVVGIFCVMLMLVDSGLFSFAATPPRILPYQGRLLDSNGVPVADASANMQFRLFDSLAAGTCLWSNASSSCASNADQSVALTSGLFSENLGDTGAGYAAIPASVFANNATVFLEVEINGETLTPRKQIGASAYALNADTLDGLDSTDFVVVNSTIHLPDGSVSTPSLAFTSDTGTGVYREQAGMIGFSSAGTNVMDLSSSGSTITSDVKINGGTNGGILAVGGGTAGVPGLEWLADADGSGTGLFRPAADVVATSTNGTERMRVTSTGNVGIGDTTPASLLTVGNGDLFQVDSSGNIVKINNVTYSWPALQGGVSTCLQNNGSGTLSWTSCSGGGGMAIGSAVTSGTPGSALFVDGSGNLGQDNANFFWDITDKRLGIGTTTPSQNLDVKGTLADSQILTENTGTGNESDFVNWNTTSNVRFLDRAFGSAIGGTFLGVNRASAVGLQVDGSSSAMLIGTVTAAPLVLGSRDTGVLTFSGADATPTFSLNTTVGTTTTGAFLDTTGVVTARSSGTTNEGDLVAHNNTDNIRFLARALGAGVGSTFLGVNRASAVALQVDGSTANFLIGSVVAAPLTLGTNNTGALTIDTSQRVGIGTTTPSSLLDVVGATPIIQAEDETGSNPVLRTTAYNASSGAFPAVQLFHAGGTRASPTATGSGFELGDIQFGGFGTSIGGHASIQSFATEAWTGSANGTDMRFLTTSNGTTADTTRLYIGQNGFVDIGNGANGGNNMLSVTGSSDISGNLALGTTSTSGVRLNVVGGTLSATADRIIHETGTLASSTAGVMEGNEFVVSTPATTSATHLIGNIFTEDGSFSGSGAVTRALEVVNTVAGANTGNPLSGNDPGNTGLYVFSGAGTAGNEVAVRGDARSSSLLNIGVLGQSISPGTNGDGVGVVGYAVNASGTGREVGGYFALGSVNPTYATTALLVDNNAVAAPIAIFRDNGSEVMRVDDGGNVGIGDATPASLLTVGSGDTFQVDSSGNIVKINNVTYSWPALQGGVSTCLQNNGSGTLTWTSCSGGGGMAIGSAVTSGTPGSALFVDASGNLGQDNANFFWDATDHRLGIGTTTPQRALDVGGTGSIELGFDNAGTNNVVKDFTTAHSAANVPSALAFGVQDGGGVAGLYVKDTRDGSFNSQSIELSTAHGGVSGQTTRLLIDKDGNVGIGDTTPAALFTVGSGDRFQVDNNGNLTSTAAITWTLPSTSNALNFDSNTLVIDASGNRVGIGTATPTQALSVGGTGNIDVGFDNAGTNVVQKAFTTAHSAANVPSELDFGVQDGGGVAGLHVKDTRDVDGVHNDQTIELSTAHGGTSSQTTRLLIDKDGNVGIGTTSPGTLLDLEKDQDSATLVRVQNANTTSNAEAGVEFSGVGGGNRAYQLTVRSLGAGAGANGLVFRDISAAADRMTLDQNGHFGIGTTSPAVPLDVAGTFGSQVDIGNTGGGNAGEINFRRGSNGDVCGNVGELAAGGDNVWLANCNGEVRLDARNADSTNIVSLYTNDIERMRVDNSGNVGIGTSPSQFLHVRKDQNAATVTEVQNGTNGGSAQAVVDAMNNAGSLAAIGQLSSTFSSSAFLPGDASYLQSTGSTGLSIFAANVIRFGTGGTNERMRIDATGNVGIGDATPAALFTVGNGDLFQVDSSGRVFAANGASGAGNLAYSFVNDTDTGFYESAANEMRFQTGGSDRITIGSTGNVGIGTANPRSALTLADGSSALFDSGFVTTPYGGFGRYENWLTFSEQFDNAAWTKESTIAISADANTAPDGTTTADRVSTGGAAATNGITQGASGSPDPSSSTWTGSVWMKLASGGPTTVNLRISTGNTTGTVSAASVTSTAWQRFSVTQTFVAAQTGTATFRIETGTATDVLLWGAELEKQSTPGIYTQTVASAVTTTTRGVAAESLSSAAFLAGDGSAGSPSFSFLSDQDNGMFHPATNQVAFSTGGTEGMRINASHHVGIGTTTPLGQFEVSGSDFSYFTANVGTTPLSASFSQGLALGWNRSNGNGESTITYSTGSGFTPRLDFSSWNGTTYATQMTIKPSGNVGIGNTNPPTRLTVQTATNDDGIELAGTTTGIAPDLKFSNASNTVFARVGLASDANSLVTGSSVDDLVIRAENKNIAFTANGGGTEQMVIQTNGNVGIGVAAPISGFEVSNAAGTNAYAILAGNANGSNPSASFTTGVGFAWNRSAGQGEDSIVYGTGVGAGPRLDFSSWDGATFATQMTIKPSGSVGIGTTNPTGNQPFSRLTVEATDSSAVYGSVINDGTGQSGLVLQRTGGTASSWVVYDATSSTDLRFFSNGSDRVTFAQNGNVDIGGTATTSLFNVGSSAQFQVDSSGRVFTPNGASGAGNLAYSFVTDTNTGLYDNGGDEIRFQTGGADQMTLNGNGLAIGTSSNASLSPLTVAGSNSTAIYGTISQAGTGQVGLQLVRSGGTASTWVMYDVPSTTNLSLFSNGFDLATFTQTGELQIGKNSGPGNASTPQYSFTLDPDTGIFDAAANTLAFSIGGTEAMRIASTGNVGIGNTSAGELLTVAKSSVGSDVFLELGNTDNTNAASNATLDIRAGGSAGGDAKEWFAVNGETVWAVGVDNSDNNKFKISNDATNGLLDNTTRLTIDSTGNVGIGDTTPASLLTVGNGDTFQVDSSGNVVKINNVTYSWPASQASGTKVLQNDGAGNLTWAAASSGANTALSNLSNVAINTSLLPGSSPTSGASSQTITTGFDAADVGGFISTAVGTDGFPVIAYFGSSTAALRVVHCGNAACSSSTVTSADTGGGDETGLYTSIAIGTDGFPIISEYDDIAGDLRVTHCGNAACSSGNTNTAVDTTVYVGLYTSIAIGTDGKAVISYYDSTNTKTKVVHCGNAACSSGNTLTTLFTNGTGTDFGQYTSLAIGSDGFPVISYYDVTNHDLRVFHCHALDCSGSADDNVIASTGDQGKYSSLKIQPDGLPIIAYEDVTNTRLRITKCGDTSCSTNNTATVSGLDNTGDNNGQYNSEAIGTDGIPVTAEYDGTTHDLHVVKCSDADCRSASPNDLITTVDSTGDVGEYTAIVIEPDGLPFISYFDATNSDLKTVKCADAACANTTGGSSTAGVDLGSSGKYFGNVYADSFWGKQFQIEGFDLAETYRVSDPSVSAGDIVHFVDTGDVGDSAPYVGKTDKAYDNLVMGVVSTKPGIALSDWKTDASARPIALNGRVPVKVNAENGPIAVGDPITSSSTQGVGMKAVKAGRIVGYALEPYTGTGQGVILVFMALGEYAGDGSTQPAAGTANTASGTSGSLSSLNMSGNIYLQGNDVIDVNKISGLGGAWSVDATGTFTAQGSYDVVIKSYQGDNVTTHAVLSPTHQVTLNGSATIQNGTATVKFSDADPTFAGIISTSAPMTVLVTPRGPAYLYVTQQDQDGFTVQQLNGADSGIRFDWFVSAYRKDHDPVTPTTSTTTDPAATTTPASADTTATSSTPTDTTSGSTTTATPTTTDPSTSTTPTTDPATTTTTTAPADTTTTATTTTTTTTTDATASPTSSGTTSTDPASAPPEPVP